MGVGSEGGDFNPIVEIPTSPHLSPSRGLMLQVPAPPSFQGGPSFPKLQGRFLSGPAELSGRLLSKLDMPGRDPSTFLEGDVFDTVM